MSLFEVDENKCTRCGACSHSCIIGLLEGPGEKEPTPPVPKENAENLCLKCGHCVAVCPEGALSHKDMPVDQCPEIRAEWQLKPEQVEHFLRSRRSIRNYHEKNADRDILAKLIDIARFAPTSRNTQSVSWTVVTGRDEVRDRVGKVIAWMRYLLKKQPGLAKANNAEKMIADYEEGIDTICWNAPHIIVAHAPKSIPLAPTDATIAMTYLELAATAYGLGTCWAGYFKEAAANWPPLQNDLGIPKTNQCCGVMLIGYPQYEYHRLPLRNSPQITWR
jgi:nitroreductase/NAD-dependent dihydropyrimidine dehydrogenase PreA subunit